MQLIFKREEDNLTIEIKDGVSTIDFDYVEMIKKILVDGQLEDTVFQGNITEEEKEKINEMVLKINESIPSEEEEEEGDDDDLPF